MKCCYHIFIEDDVGNVVSAGRKRNLPQEEKFYCDQNIYSELHLEVINRHKIIISSLQGGAIYESL